MILGLHGRSQGGKDTVAAYLVRAHGFRMLRISESIKREVYECYRLTLRAHAEMAYGEAWHRMSEPQRDEFVWALLTTHRDPVTRRFLQEHGVMRRVEDADYWTTVWKADALMADTAIVAPDVRFDNEVLAIRALGGKIVKVVRPSLGNTIADGHVSEQELDGPFDGVLVNDGTIADLEATTEGWMTRHAQT